MGTVGTKIFGEKDMMIFTGHLVVEVSAVLVSRTSLKDVFMLSVLSSYIYTLSSSENYHIIF